MKNIILLFILLLFFPKAYSQISSSAFITFKYDDSGNQIERKFSQLNIETDKNGIKDSISTIENLIKIFPNPTKGNFYIEWDKTLIGDIAKIEIYSTSGLIKQFNIAPLQDKLKIDITSQIAGIYFTRLYFLDGTIISKKIIKN